MALKLAVVIQPPKSILDEALSAVNAYTKEQYGKTSKYIRYVYPEKVVFRVPHVTLRASSIVEADEIDGFISKIRTVAQEHNPFKLTLDGTRSFRNHGRTTVYYWNVEPNPTLKSLYKELRKSLEEKGGAFYHEQYHPHLTLIVDEMRNSPLKSAKPVDLPKRTCTIDRLTLLYRNMGDKPVSYQKVYKTIQLGG